MRGDKLADADNVSRYCSANKFEDGNSDAGILNGLAFKLTDSDSLDPHLSCNWLEYFSELSRDEQVNEIRKIFDKKFEVKQSARLVVLNVGDIINYLIDEASVSIHHKEEDDDVCHAGIFDMCENLEVDHDVLGDMLAELANERAEIFIAKITS